MGWGDDLMWLGEAEKVHKENPDALIHAGTKKSKMWKHVDWVIDHDEETDRQKIFVDPKPNNGQRWYIHSFNSNKMGRYITYTIYEPKPAPYCVSDIEEFSAIMAVSRKTTRPFVVLNPDSKNTTLADNKDWGFERWQQLCDLVRRKYDVIRIKPKSGYRDVSGKVEYNQPELEGAINIETNDIREAFAIASQAKAIITTEGGMHHFAASQNIPAFVIFGGVIAPTVTGYKDRNQIYYTYEDELTPCGMQQSCDHCKEAMESITPSEIYEDFIEFMNGNKEKIYR